MFKYYFLGTILPDLELGQPAPISLEDIGELLKENLTAVDYRKVSIIRRFYDLENLRTLWKGEGRFDLRGELKKADLQETLRFDEALPAYVREFLSEHMSVEERLRYFPSLLAAFYKVEALKTRGALKAWLQFERELWLIQAAYRASKMGRDLTTELPFEDHEDGFLEQLLASCDERGVHLPQGFEGIQGIFDAYYDAPLQLHQALCRYRFEKIQNLMCKDIFSFDHILGSMIQLFIMQNHNI